MAAFSPIGETFDEILAVELQLPIKTSKCQPREESYLGKRKFYQTCLNQRQINKPSKLRRKEKKFHSSVHACQASSLSDLLAAMDSEFETMNMQLPEPLNQPTRLANLGRQNGGVMLDVRNEALYI